jgi:hypothetical protein
MTPTGMSYRSGSALFILAAHLSREGPRSRSEKNLFCVFSSDRLRCSEKDNHSRAAHRGVLACEAKSAAASIDAALRDLAPAIGWEMTILPVA